MAHWLLCTDEQGNAYYYNEDTEECVWEKPEDYHEEDNHEVDEETKSKIQKALMGAKKPLGPELQAKLDKVKEEQKA